MTTDSDRRLRVVLIAPCCDGTDVGEAWSTHQWVSRLAKEHDVTVLTYQKRGRASATSQLPGVEVVEWQDWPLVGRFERFNSGLKPGYLGFYWKARAWLRREILRGRPIDLVHQISPLALRYPSPATGLGVPVVMGPLGGSLDPPAGFAGELGSVPWYARLRALDPFRFRFDPWLRRTYREAAAIVGVAPYVRELLSGIGLRRFEVMSETGVIALPPACGSREPRSSTLRLLFVGRLVRTKGVRDLIRAVGRLEDVGNIHLDVVGAGVEREVCESLARELGVSDRVTFHGQVPRARVDDFYRNASLFTFPSFCEASGNVVLEALSWGLPVLAANAGGPGFVVDETCGVKVPVSTPEQFATALAGAIRELAGSPTSLAKLSEGARRRVEQLALWENKVMWMSELYRSIHEQRRTGAS